MILHIMRAIDKNGYERQMIPYLEGPGVCASRPVLSTRMEHGCCSNTYWDPDDQQCKPCKRGNTGRNCETKCKYPHYGMDCLQECQCNKSNCDFQIGCQLLTDSTILDDLISTKGTVFEKNNTLPDNFTPNANGSITNYSSVSYTFTTNYTTEGKENPLLYLILVLGLLFITGIFAYFIIIVYVKLKGNVQLQVSEISGPESSHYEEPCDLVHLHI